MADLLSVSDAADMLNLSSARVRLLVANGDLAAEKIGGRWVVERGAVERRRRHGSSGGRRFIPRNAWSVLGLASGEQVDAIDAAARSRLRRTLALERLGALSPRLEQRAKVARYRAHPGEVAHTLADPRLLVSGVSAARALGLDLLAGREADGYIRASALDEFVDEHALSPAATAEANVTLRAVPDDIWDLFLAGRAHAPAAAVALDLAEEPDSRSQAAGEDLLARLDRMVP
jgi:excisionase family DNA binding protein